MVKKQRKLSDWLFIILQTLFFTVILLWITSYTQDIDLEWQEWVGLPLLVTFVISLLGVLLLDDYLNGEN